jgi:DNA mismatch repair protein MutS
VIDKTLSPMGGRLLKRWLALPLKRPIKLETAIKVSYLRKSGGSMKNTKSD